MWRDPFDGDRKSLISYNCRIGYQFWLLNPFRNWEAAYSIESALTNYADTYETYAGSLIGNRPMLHHCVVAKRSLL